MMRYPFCKITYHDGTLITDSGQVTINGESPAARIAVYEHNGSRFEMTDRLENCEVVNDRDGTITITGDSVYLEQNQGVLQKVRLVVIPGPEGCSNCS